MQNKSKNEESHIQQKLILHSILESVGEGIITIDGQGIITIINPAALGILVTSKKILSAMQWIA